MALPVEWLPSWLTSADQYIKRILVWWCECKAATRRGASSGYSWPHHGPVVEGRCFSQVSINWRDALFLGCHSLDGILFILTGNDDIHKSLDEFEIRPDPTTDHRACCP